MQIVSLSVYKDGEGVVNVSLNYLFTPSTVRASLFNPWGANAMLDDVLVSIGCRKGGSDTFRFYFQRGWPRPVSIPIHLFWLCHYESR